MTDRNCEELGNMGWTDRDILDIVHVTAYFNLRVRVVDGLGPELGNWQIERSGAGSERVAKLAEERGLSITRNPWGVRR